MTSTGLHAVVRDSIRQWFNNRVQECFHCSQCDARVTPFATHCPNCGQTNPAKVSTSAVVGMIIGFVVVTLLLSFLIIVF
jgi:hypothetical protein